MQVVLLTNPGWEALTFIGGVSIIVFVSLPLLI
jgi:hypothetical protein